MQSANAKVESRESAHESRKGACIPAKVMSQLNPAIMFAASRAIAAGIGYFPARGRASPLFAASIAAEDAPRRAKRKRVACASRGREKERAAIANIMHPAMKVFLWPREASRSCAGVESAACAERKSMYENIMKGRGREADALRRKIKRPALEARKRRERGKAGGRGFALGKAGEFSREVSEAYFGSFFMREGMRAREAGIAESRIMLRTRSPGSGVLLKRKMRRRARMGPKRRPP